MHRQDWVGTGRRGLAPPPKREARDTSAVSVDELRRQLGALEGKRDHFSKREAARLRRELERRGAT